MSWGITRALHRVGAAFYVYFATAIIFTLLTIAFMIYVPLDLLLTAIPMVFDDGMPIGGRIVDWFKSTWKWTRKNTVYIATGDGKFLWTASGM